MKKQLSYSFVLLVAAVVFGGVILAGCTSTPSSDTTTSSSEKTTTNLEKTAAEKQDNEKKPEKSDDFDAAAKAKLDDVATEIPELSSKGIECFEGDCSVVYFNFTTLPDDYKMIISGNAITLSNLKKEKTGVSHVSVSAKQGGQVVVICRASGGVINECEDF